MLLAAVDSTAYNIVLVLHLLTVVVGFGNVLLSGIYGNRAMEAQGAEGRAIFEANFAVGRIAEWCIYAVPIFGILLLFLSGTDVGGETRYAYWFDQAWISASFLLYIIALVVSLFVLQPTLRKMRRVLADGGGPELEALGKRMAMVSPVLHLSFVVILVLMVFKPGL